MRSQYLVSAHTAPRRLPGYGGVKTILSDNFTNKSLQDTFCLTTHTNCGGVCPSPEICQCGIPNLLGDILTSGELQWYAMVQLSSNYLSPWPKLELSIMY